MQTRVLFALFGLMLAVGVRAQAPPVPAPPTTPNAATPEQGLSILGRGPVHEAFAQPVTKDPQPTPVIPKQPPPPVQELPPSEKPADPNAEWIPGYWQWDVTRNDFIWVSGVWRVPPPGRQWVPGYWRQVNGGSQWVPGLWAPVGQQTMPYDSPPPPSLEVGPSAPAPDQDHIYVPGSWIERDSSYAWRPGYWTNGYDNWVWQPSHYAWTPAGCILVPGYWDRPLEDRGLLFAPVAFDQSLLQDAAWSYTPSYVIDPAAMLDCLFYQPNWGNYCFGDYYNPYFGQTYGFQPWWGYGRGYYDPLFAFYGRRHRFDRGWMGGLRNNFFARRNGRLAGPPLSLAAQRTFARGSRGGGRFASGGFIRPLSRTSGLRQLNGNQLRSHIAVSQHFGRLGQTRSRVEATSRVSPHRARTASYRLQQPGSGTRRYAGYFGRSVQPLTPAGNPGVSRGRAPQHFSRHAEWYGGRSGPTAMRPRSAGGPIMHQSLASPRSMPGRRSHEPQPGGRFGVPPHMSAPPSSSHGGRHERSAGSAHHSAPPSFGGHSGGSPSHGGHSGGSHSSGGHGGGHSSSHSSGGHGGHGGGHHR